MKRVRHSEETIIKAIKQYESGVKVADICRELGINIRGQSHNYQSKSADIYSTHLIR